MKIEPILNILEKKPGERIVYYRGFIMYDRAPQPSNRRTAKHNRVTEVANTAWELFESGKIMLVQKRRTMPKEPGGIGTFDYIAIRRDDAPKTRSYMRYGKAA